MGIMEASSAKHRPANVHATRTIRNEMVMAGPAPGRPSVDAAAPPCSSRSRTVACSIDSTVCVLPAAAVPVTVKIPEPMTIPTPRNARLHGPSDFFRRWDGASEEAIRSSMLLHWKRDIMWGGQSCWLPWCMLQQYRQQPAKTGCPTV